MRVALVLALALLAGDGAVAADKPERETTSVALFSQMQERDVSTPEEVEQRTRTMTPEAAAAAAALNDWKICVIDALGHWAELGQGPGTLVDGAYGRCGDQARLYRDRLLKLSQNGRILLDVQFARAMVKGLEEAWRPRLIAMALDQELAMRSKPVPPVPASPKSR